MAGSCERGNEIMYSIKKRNVYRLPERLSACEEISFLSLSMSSSRSLCSPSPIIRLFSNLKKGIRSTRFVFYCIHEIEALFSTLVLVNIAFELREPIRCCLSPRSEVSTATTGVKFNLILYFASDSSHSSSFTLCALTSIS